MKRISLLCMLTALCLMLAACGGEAQQPDSGEHLSQNEIHSVRINEGMSRNSCFAPLPDGSFCDWVELHNPTGQDIDLKGWALSDDDRKLLKWKIDDSFVVEAGGYALIYLSGLDGTDEDGNLHTSFRLSSAGETLILSDRNGHPVHTWRMPECPADNVSWGSSPDGSGENGWLSQPTPGKENTGFFSADIDTLEYPSLDVVISEYMGNNCGTVTDCDSEYSDWIELHNPTGEAVDLSACSLSDDSDGGSRWFFPAGTVIEPEGYLVVFCSGKVKGSDCEELHAGFRLGAEDSAITLYTAAGQAADSLEYRHLPENVSCGRDPDSGEPRLFSKATPGRANTTFSYELTAEVTADLSRGVYISEAMSVSASAEPVVNYYFVELHAPPAGDVKLSRDFIELHNSTSSAVSLEGYKLTTGSEEVCFIFPDIEIAPNGYVTVYCTGEESQADTAGLTAPFKLDRSGESIVFYDSDGQCIDRFSTGKQTYGCSRGRVEGNMQQVYVFDRPTPGAVNVTGRYLGYAPEPVITTADGQEGGYVTAGTRVVIQAPDDCTVHYTTNGDDPTVDSPVYSGPFEISETTTVRAIAVKALHQPSDVAVCSFLTGDLHDIPVVMLSAPDRYLLSPEEGILSSHHNGLIAAAANFYSEIEREVSIEYYVDGMKAFDLKAGLRVFGETSRRAPQKGMAVYLREKYDVNTLSFPIFDDYDVTTFGSFLLRPSGQDYGQAHMRDELCAMLFKDHLKADYMAVKPVALYINGEYYGLYYIREKYNEDYLVNHYGADPDEVDIVKWQGESQAGSASDYKKLTKYVAEHNMAEKEHYDYFCRQVDIDSLIDFWVGETFMANNDSGNIRCYRTSQDGKWRWMLFDFDFCMRYGNWNEDFVWQHCLDPNGHGDSDILPNDIPRRLFANEDFRQRFLERYCYHLQTTFSSERVLEVFEELRSQIETEMPRQAERWGEPSAELWASNCKMLRNALSQRNELVRGHLKKNFDLTDRELDRLMKQTANGVD